MVVDVQRRDIGPAQVLEDAFVVFRQEDSRTGAQLEEGLG